ncbi:hypothetical protein Sjap_004268 [Stephania japonica]|uniref:Uncharacterized protein n=1 Tax=Stephania japonica TaxID=461633 RepID=A0AAP0K2Z0_9MAGN
MTATLKNMNDKEKLSLQPIFHSEETLNVVTSKTVILDELSIMDYYWSEPEETLEVSLHEPNIIIAQNEKDVAEKEIEVISERSKEPQKKRKEYQPLIFYTADTFVSNDHDATESFVLEIPDELLNLKEGMLAELLKAIDVPFVVDISKGKGIT